MNPDPVAGEPPSHAPRPPQDWLMWVVIGLVALTIVFLAAALLLPEPAEAPAESPPVISTTASPAASTPVHTTPGGTVRPTLPRTPAPGTPVPGTATPAGETTSLPPAGTVPAPACTPAGPPGFTVTVSPARASAARGETVTYRMVIEAQNCFSESVSMTLTANLLFFSQTYALGTQGPPYPKSFEYALTVPDTLYPGATVNGMLVSTGGGITRENELTLTIR